MPKTPQSENMSMTVDRRRDTDALEDSTTIAEQLSQNRNLDLVLNRYSSGNAEVRDVARYTRNERNTMMNFGRLTVARGVTNIDVDDPVRMQQIIAGAASNFVYAMQDRTGYSQASAGYNFAVNASSFRDAGLSWAANLDRDLGAWLNVRGSGINNLIQKGSGAENQIRTLLADYAYANPVDLAWYLAERSQHSENYQRERYVKDMIEAKRNASTLMHDMARAYNLPLEHLNRSLKQLSHTDFSAFDHIVGGVTQADQGSLGDYLPGTFRVEVKYGGSPNQPTWPRSPMETLLHEIHHSASAQDAEGSVGLRAANGHGTAPNEGMTEMLTQIGQGNITHGRDGHIRFHPETAYIHEVASMYQLMVYDEKHFVPLHHAYYGYVPDKNALKSSLDAFYSNLRTVSGR